MNTTPTLATLEFYQGELRFSAGHFTVFSKTHREHLHGHNYFIQAKVTAEFQEPGISFDYHLLSIKLLELCKQLNSRFLLAGTSPYLKIEEDERYYKVHFNDEEIPFLKRDALILDLPNITLEELAHWFVLQLLEDPDFIQAQRLHSIMIKVFNGPEQSASYVWEKEA